MLLAIVLCSQSPAQADCRHPDRPSISIETSRPDGLPDSPEPPQPPSPCSGFRCSGNATPPINAANLAHPRTDSWGLSSEPIRMDRPGSFDLVAEDPRVSHSRGNVHLSPSPSRPLILPEYSQDRP